MPGTTSNVVKSNEPTFELAPVKLFNRVDLPTLGNPIIATVASPLRLIS